jgi:hypothetical protein
MSKPEKSWFRAYAEMVDDEKLRLLAFEDRWHFVALLCCKRSGLLDHGDPHELLCRKVAVKLGLQLRELEAAAGRLGEVGLIDPATFQPLAWAERQFESDSSTERVREWRARKRQADAVSRDETTLKHSGNVSVTAQETETETETEHIRPSPARARESEPADVPTSALAARAMIDAGLSPTMVNPSHPELLAARVAGVTPAELADVTRELISRGTGPPAMVYVIRTAMGRRRTAARQQETADADATTHRPRSPGRQSAGRASSAVGRQLDAIKRRREREAAAAGADCAASVGASQDG